ncbi:adenylate cyclase type 6-like, partial [Watersipora subatra]|uniref:adenylate cyclase type 6-like n=1 Tax=Watersipora subatra TaxID=2589382 RepID=UPI00355BA5F8
MEGLRSQSSQHKEKTILECRICSPPYVFRHKPTEALFLEYSFHIRRVTVSSLLGIYILLMAVLAILYFAYQRRPTEQNLYHVCLCVLGILLYIFINTEYFSSVKQLNIASYLLWTLLLLFGFISLPLGPWTEKMADKDTVYAAEGVWQLVFIIYCLYLILSVNFFMTVLFGLVLALVHTGVILIRLRDLSSIAENWIEIMVSGILFLAANGVGILAHHVGEKSQRESFINCRAYIGAKLQLQDEGQKLVKVAEMCLPKFLCHEVCADLTMYNSVVCPRQIFAKSYDNVSIAYINITGLEKLKVQIESSEYVSIINDLSVTFEALCEVHNCLALVQLGERFAAVSGIPVSDARGTHSCVSLCVD